MDDATPQPPAPGAEPGPETPRPDRSFQGAGHPADDRPISAVARRLGPPIAGGALAVTFALLAWMALAPTSIAGPIGEAPFVLSATLVIPPTEDSCLTVVDGDGATAEHCDGPWSEETVDGWVEAYFDDRGRLLVGEYSQLTIVDPESGQVLGTVDRDAFDARPGRPIDDLGRYAQPEGDRVFVVQDSDRPIPAPQGGDLVLDLAGPWGYRVTDAVLSPDGEWVLARTNRNQVVVAPTDGSAAPHLWTEVPSQRWVDLRSNVRWDG